MNKEFVDHEQMIKNLLVLKSEIIGQWNNHNLVVQVQDLLDKLNHCMYDDYSSK